MTGVELSEALVGIGLSQVQFARLLTVTPRAVQLWISDQRHVPGPVGAYLRLFRTLPPERRQEELARVSQLVASIGECP